MQIKYNKWLSMKNRIFLKLSQVLLSLIVERSSNIAKLIAECRSQRNSSRHGLHVCLSHRGLDSRDVVYAQGDYSFHEK